MSILFSKTIIKDRIKAMQEMPSFDWELSDEEWLKTRGKICNVMPDDEIVEDAISALQILGYKKKSCKKYVNTAILNGAKTVESIVTLAIKAAQKEKNL